MNIVVDEKDIDLLGKRLDLFLSIKLQNIPRSVIKRMIESNVVKLNGVVFYKAGYKVKLGDSVEFPLDMIQEKDKKKKFPLSPFDLEVIFEDDDYLIINKPIGITVHPTSYEQNDTVVNKILSLKINFPETHFLRPGIVHRIDKETSGILAIAKNSKSLWWLSKQFAERKVNKSYVSIGLSSREIKESSIEFSSYIYRNPRDRVKMYVEPIDHDINENTNVHKRFSKTKFEIILQKKIDNNFFLIKSNIYPVTGRTHQIRVHQKYLGFPVLGDLLYMSNNEINFCKEFLKKNNIRFRLFLHAEKLSFSNYNGKHYNLIAPLPLEFKNLD